MAQKATDKTKSKKVALKPEAELPSTVSLQKVMELSKMLARGKSKQYIIDYAMEKYGVGEPQAKRYYSAAVRNLVPDDVDEYRKGLIQTNFNRLETIVEKAMEEGDWKNARETIAEMNKMCGVTGQGVQVGINNDKENNTQQIVIKFDS